MSTGAKKAARYTIVFVILGILLFALLVANINTGNVNIDPISILKILFTRQGDPNELNIIFKIRLPRLIMAGILVGAFALAGFLLQTFFANPIAGPFVLGISSGAKMVVAVVMIYFLDKLGKVSSVALVVAAFVGALLSTLFILTISHHVRAMSGLLVAGIMIGYICNAVTDFIVTFAEDSDIVNLRGWSLGSFSGMSFEDVKVAAVVVGIAALLVFFLSKPIGAFQLGENYAQSMGVNVKRFRVYLILLSSILAACVTAYAGPISFVGIAVPFLMKRSLGTAKPIIVVPAAFLGGAVFCMFSDLIARMAFAPTELNISTVTSLFGAPIVIYMLIQKKSRSEQ